MTELNKKIELETSTDTAIDYSTCYAQVFSRLFFGDCLIESDKIETGSVDLILTDLPYGNMKGINNPERPKSWGNKEYLKWDDAIDPKSIYEIANRILRKNGRMVLFSQEPYTTKLINEAIPNIPFNYRAIWEKDNFANALLCNKAMVGFYEDILIFSKTHGLKTDNEVRDYLVSERQKTKEAGYTDKQLRTMCGLSLKGGGLLCHYWGREQWMMPTEKHYNTLSKTGYFKRPYEELKQINDNLKKEAESTFNLWEGNKYKSNILKYKKDYNGYHPTQKPVLLLEDLIKTFSNENDLVVDLTMGSGSTGVACKNTNRNFIGIEKDENYFKIAEQRINARTLF
jgi:site-specific DNA-methyltransferase (adenine-specific)